jgi:23S rRNA (adenine2503-C2)-methyltransferase
MKVLGEFGKEDLAKVYVSMMRNDEKYLVEFAESIQPPLPFEKKWVIIVSTLFGCPVKCKMCDAGRTFYGMLTSDEMLQQIDYLVARHFSDHKILVEKFKIQFARMGEPVFNPNVLDVLEKLHETYDAPGLIPCISTIAPAGTEEFFEKLIQIKKRFYSNGYFQLQFSVHSTNTEKRDKLMPVKKWGFEEIAKYGERFFEPGDRKITLNFAAAKGYEIEPKIIRECFNPEKFLIKLTPLNPTNNVKKNELVSFINPSEPGSATSLINSFQSYGFETILSIGELEENGIGSNCGQFIS